MFSQALQTTGSRARSLWCAAVLALLATIIAAGSAQASPVPAGDAVIASASGATITTTSGSPAAPVGSNSRSAAGSPGNALTLNSSVPTPLSPTRPPAAKTPSASQLGTPSLEAPIVGSPGRRPADPATLAQIQSAGPIVASSGTPSAGREPAGRSAHRFSATSLSNGYRAYATTPVSPPSSALEINAPGVHFFISRTVVRRPAAPGARTAALNSAVARQIGTPGYGYSGLLPTDPRPAPAPGGPANTTLYGSASGSTGGTALVGVDALLTVAVLLVGAAWRRRSWDLPVLPSQSALLSLALDRPG